MAAGRQRHGLVEKVAHVLDDLAAAHRIVLRGLLAAGDFENDVGAVEGVVQAVPARVGRVERIAGVVHRDHELRPGDQRDFVVDVFGRDLALALLRDQVADVLQQCLVGSAVVLPFMLPVPLVEPGLQVVPFLQMLAIDRTELVQYARESIPERGAVDAAARHGLALDQVVQRAIHAETADFDSVAHRLYPV